MGKQKLVMIYDCYFLLSKAESFDCYKPQPEKAKVRIIIQGYNNNIYVYVGQENQSNIL